MSPTRRGFLASSAALGALATLGLPGIAAAAGASRKLVLVHARGGWDVTCALDPKLGVDSIDGPQLDEDRDNPDDREAVETLHGIPLVVNRVKRPGVARFFERWGDGAAVLNGIWTGAISHPACTTRMFTGARTEAYPDVAAITAASVGADTPIPYMDLSGSGIAGPLAAYVGRTGLNNQLELLLDRSTPMRGPRGSGFTYPGFRPQSADEADLRAFLEARDQRLSGRSWPSERSELRVDDVIESRTRADALRAAGEEFADQLELGRQADLLTMAPTIRDLLSSGLCHAVSVDTGADFDTHQDNADQHAAWERAFLGLEALMSELSAGNLLDDTVVVVLSEMTRTPRRNGDGGKDHWPVTAAMVLGSGVTGGRVLGGTTELLDGMPVDLQTGVLTGSGVVPRYDNLAAGILELTGVDPAEWLPNVTPYRGFHA